ncbi:MAG: hypothetical protein GKS06_02340 [Acidobacteria bacterium]|nr:hypothetical protein [Acidobacteriota bacterium]
MSPDNVLRFQGRPAARLLKSFPESALALERLYASDREFREICGDLERVEARLDELEADANSRLWTEYTALRRDLVAEIAERLGNDARR